MSMHQVWFLLFEHFQLLDVCGPLQVFATANDELQLAGRKPLYVTRVCAMEAGLLPSSSGVALQADALPRRLSRRLDTAIIPGGPGAWNPTGGQTPASTETLVEWVRRSAPRVSRLASVCTGAFVLARTGLLDSRSAVTHWAC